MSESDFLPEGTLRGLPGPLPKGERILWQGAPSTAGVWLHVFHVRLVAAWFLGAGLLLALVSGRPALAVLAPTLAILAGAVALLWVLAWLCHRTTVYTLTDRRLVLHIGIALPITLNLPFAKIETAALRRYRDGSGDLPIRLQAGVRVAYLQLWPHGRPWHFSRPEPMLRAVPDAGAVAERLAQALRRYREDGPEDARLPVIVSRPGRVEHPGRLVAAE